MERVAAEKAAIEQAKLRAAAERAAAEKAAAEKAAADQQAAAVYAAAVKAVETAAAAEQALARAASRRSIRHDGPFDEPPTAGKEALARARQSSRRSVRHDGPFEEPPDHAPPPGSRGPRLTLERSASDTFKAGVGIEESEPTIRRYSAVLSKDAAAGSTVVVFTPAGDPIRVPLPNEAKTGSSISFTAPDSRRGSLRLSTRGVNTASSYQRRWAAAWPSAPCSPTGCR